MLQHWFIHRSVWKGGPYTDIVDDDGEVYRLGGSRLALDTRAPWADREGPEIFIDIPNVSRYRKGEVFRIRTKTMSPVFLKSYRALWRERSLRVRQRLQRNLLPWPDAIAYPACDHGDELVKTELGCTCTCGSGDYES
ncbi:hypothetical protein LXA43DRAFT_601416 [Ganoderma leucocontextum]|nr:hypothetical protein LXA43DRAFT_601416 [Ganoderma leucocontextum]